MNRFLYLKYFLFIIFFYSCLTKTEHNDLQVKQIDSIKNEIDSIVKVITKRNTNIDYYRELLLPFMVSDPLGLIVCISDPSEYSYLRFYKNSYYEEVPEGYNSSKTTGTWKFENDTIYLIPNEYKYVYKISFKVLLEESQSFSPFFGHSIVGLMKEQELEKKYRVGKGESHPQTSHRTVLEPLDSHGSSR